MDVLSERGYSAMRNIGEGSFGCVVYALTQGQEVSIKIINTSDISKMMLDQVTLEAKIHNKMKHRNIVICNSFFNTNDHYFLEMEYCDGGTLYELRHCGWLPEAFCRRVAFQLTEALLYMRSNRISHFDIKSSNIMLTTQPMLDIKLGDFGMSMVLRDESVIRSKRGSPMYMAPEILMRKNFGPSADLWSTGLVVYECLFGEFPFTCRSIEELINVLNSMEHVPVPVNCDISRDARHFINALLTVNADARLTFAELAAQPFRIVDRLTAANLQNKCLQLIDEASTKLAHSKFNTAFMAYHEALQLTLPCMYMKSENKVKEQYKETMNRYIDLARNTNVLERQHLIASEVFGEDVIELVSAVGIPTGAREELDLLCNTDNGLALILANGRKQGQGTKLETLEALNPNWAALLMKLSMEPMGRRRDLLQQEACAWILLAERIKLAVLEPFIKELDKLDVNEAGTSA